MCWEPYFTSFLKGVGARVNFVRSKYVKNCKFPDLKLDTFVVPLEAKIELCLQREAHSQFPVRPLGIAKIYHQRTLSRPCNVLRPLFFSGLERFCKCVGATQRFRLSAPGRAQNR